MLEPVRKRILMLASTFARGGCERQILSATVGLRERTYQVAVLAFARPHPDQSLEAEIRERSIPLHFSDEFPLDLGSERVNELAVSLPDGMLNYAASVQSAILQYRPHVVHAWSDYAAIVGGRMAAALDVPRIILGQRNVSPPSHLREDIAIYREGYRDLAADPRVILINNSARNASEYERWLDLPEGTVAVVRNGLVPNTIRMPSPDAVRQTRRDLGIPEGAKVVGSLMRFVEQKDPDLWLATAQQIARHRDDVSFVLGGYGELSDKIASGIRAMGLSHRFVLLDGRSDLGLFYGLLDVFLMTSRFEGTPNVLIEAQAASCPIVTTDAGGIRETVADGLTARIVSNRSPAKLAAAVVEVLEDDKWRSRAGEAGPTFVRQRFGHARMIAQMLQLYYPPASIGRIARPSQRALASA
jgi:glycosyltransferase involved in cell wall biosynthesis